MNRPHSKDSKDFAAWIVDYRFILALTVLVLSVTCILLALLR